MERAKPGDPDFDPDFDEFGVANMFTDTDYQEITYEYEDVKQTIYALKAASTDYDMTGQIVWQAADIFCKWLFAESEQAKTCSGESIFKGKRVVELGSGPGLGGFVAARWADWVCLSDY